MIGLRRFCWFGRREGARTYRVWGKVNLDDAARSEVDAGGESAYRFFRVTVEMLQRQ